MRTLKTSEAAALLNVTANTLRAWERRFGYPRPQRSRGNHRLYTYAEVAALREALQEGLSISSAVSVAREALSTDVHALVRALAAFDVERGDRALEASLGLRSVERTVEEVLLPALREIHRREGGDDAHWAFAAHWACDWLRRTRRLSSPPSRGVSIIVGDACGGDLDPIAALVRSLELFCHRAGADVLTLPVQAHGGLIEAVAAVQPDVILIAGSRADDEALARWAYRIRTAAGRLPMALFHRDVHAVGPESRARILSPVASTAQEELLALVEPRAAGARRRAPASPSRNGGRASRTGSRDGASSTVREVG